MLKGIRCLGVAALSALSLSCFSDNYNSATKRIDSLQAESHKTIDDVAYADIMVEVGFSYEKRASILENELILSGNRSKGACCEKLDDLEKALSAYRDARDLYKGRDTAKYTTADYYFIMVQDKIETEKNCCGQNIR